MKTVFLKMSQFYIKELLFIISQPYGYLDTIYKLAYSTVNYTSHNTADVINTSRCIEDVNKQAFIIT